MQATWYGLMDYESAWSLQRDLFNARSIGVGDDSLMLLEHPPTYTLGRRADSQDVIYPESELERRGISLFRIDRGGRATYHGPGQLVAYPILALGQRYDVLGYLRKLEGVVIGVAAELGVEAHRDDDHTGVWVGSNKLAAIGVKITRGTTMHGFALNVTTDLSMFEGIVPCGIKDRWVTSIEAETGVAHPTEVVARIAARRLASALERELTWGDHRKAFDADDARVSAPVS